MTAGEDPCRTGRDASAVTRSELERRSASPIRNRSRMQSGTGRQSLREKRQRDANRRPLVVARVVDGTKRSEIPVRCDVVVQAQSAVVVHPASFRAGVVALIDGGLRGKVRRRVFDDVLIAGADVDLVSDATLPAGPGDWHRSGRVLLRAEVPAVPE